MPSITTWTRLEPLCRDDDMRSGLEARVYDPLWALGRQWQLSEFQAEDAGSPVLARVQTASHPLGRYFGGALPPSGKARGEKYDPATMPLETLVEREPVNERGTPSLRLAIDAGRQFLRFAAMHRATVAAKKFLKSHALVLPSPEELARLDDDTRQLYEVCGGRVIDGARLYRDFTKKAPARSGIGKAVQAWMNWYRAIFSEPAGGKNPAWLEDHLEYRFAVGTRTKSGEVVLEAKEYVEGRLDWYDFAIRPGGALGTKASEAPGEKLDRALIPAPISYAGMPAERWWEFEDARIHFGAVDVQPGDVVSSVLLQFAIIYGNDWFVVPVSAAVGSLCEVQSLIVTDGFGVETTIDAFHRAHPEWRLFSLSQPKNTDRELFFLPPVLSHATAGPVREEVLLARDEMTNMAWAVERLIESPGGAIIDHRGSAVPQGGDSPLPSGTRLRYRLRGEAPDNWIPFVPMEDTTDGRGVRLRRARLDRPAQGKIIGSPTAHTIANEEVPKTGVVVTRSPQWARWIDGSSQLWIGRRKLPGNGEASSGLRFDFLQPPT